MAQAMSGLQSTDFLEAQKNNRTNTTCLILILRWLGAFFGYLLGLTAEAASSYYDGVGQFDPLAPSLYGFWGSGIFVGIGIVASFIAILARDRVIVGLTGAKDVTSDEEPVLHNVVEEMAIASGLPKPRIVLVETEAMNAFAAGMRPERAALGVTRGLVSKLTRAELQGVIGHEMGHIANWDIRYMTAVGILVGLIALVADAIKRMVFYSSLGRSRSRSSGSGDGGGGAVVVILIVIVFLFSILAPIAASFVRFAVSRQREYLADATSVQFTRNPQAMISTLEKLAAQAEPFDGANRATQHMFIINPFRNFDKFSGALMSTHPPVESRIDRLRDLGSN